MATPPAQLGPEADRGVRDGRGRVRRLRHVPPSHHIVPELSAAQRDQRPRESTARPASANASLSNGLSR